MRPALKQFDTEQELTDYADMLNEAGGILGQPEIAAMDSRGHSFLACLQAPGGDGWGFAYYGVNEEDGYVINSSSDDDLTAHATPIRYIGEGLGITHWEPLWPVFGIVMAAS